MAELDDIIHQPLRLRIMAALNALPAGRGAGILPAEKADRRHRRQSRRPYRDAGEGRLCRGRKGLCRQEAADHGDRDRVRARRVRPPCRDPAGDHRGLGGQPVGCRLSTPSFRGARSASEPGISSWDAPAQDNLEIPDRRAWRAVRNDGVWLAYPLAAEGRLVRPTRLREHPSGCISCTSSCSVPAAANMLWRGRSRLRRW